MKNAIELYDNNLDNQHNSMRKFMSQWFGPYVVTSANDNPTYHLVELDGTRLAISIADKRVNIFKKCMKMSNLDELKEDEYEIRKIRRHPRGKFFISTR